MNQCMCTTHFWEALFHVIVNIFGGSSLAVPQSRQHMWFSTEVQYKANLLTGTFALSNNAILSEKVFRRLGSFLYPFMMEG